MHPSQRRRCVLKALRPNSRQDRGELPCCDAPPMIEAVLNGILPVARCTRNVASTLRIGPRSAIGTILTWAITHPKSATRLRADVGRLGADACIPGARVVTKRPSPRLPRKRAPRASQHYGRHQSSRCHALLRRRDQRSGELGLTASRSAGLPALRGAISRWGWAGPAARPRTGNSRWFPASAGSRSD